MAEKKAESSIVPCRRRAIWAAQAALQETKHEQKSEDLQSADDTTYETFTAKANAKKHADEALQIGACPKCGKVIGRGRYFHEKYCKG